MSNQADSHHVDGGGGGGGGESEGGGTGGGSWASSTEKISTSGVKISSGDTGLDGDGLLGLGGGTSSPAYLDGGGLWGSGAALGESLAA